MADIRLTENPDDFTQASTARNEWNNHYGLAGDDTIRLYQGVAIGGPGNDRIERLAYPNEPWRVPQLGYWDSPKGIVANLVEGWVDDGWGTRDTFFSGAVSEIHGSSNNDRFIGGPVSEFFHPNGGQDTLDGGGGYDGFDVREIPPSPDGRGTWRPARLDDLDIQVSADGTQTTVTVKHYPQFRYTTTNMEYLRLVDGTTFVLSDLITQGTMARDVVAAGGAQRWNAGQSLGTAVTLSYSFVQQTPGSGPGADGFRPFTPAEQQVVRDLLALSSKLAGLSFTEVTESPGMVGQLRFGVSQQATTKGVSYMPGLAGDLAGDVWMDVESMFNLAPGSPGRAALLHEIGHALGLRHPRNIDSGDKWSIQLRPQDDRTSLTVMSQTLSADELYRADWGPLDVLALRYLYGSATVNTDNTRYLLGSAQLAAQTTLVDDGGTDTIDASGLSAGATIDLNPGRFVSAGLTATGFGAMENVAIAGSSWIENAVGTPFDDVLLGNALNNTIQGGPGNDWIDGGLGVDTAVFEGKLADYWIRNTFGKLEVEAKDGRSGYDTVLNVEKLAFADGTIEVDRVSIQGELRQGERLVAQVQLIDASRAGTLTYRWQADGQDIIGATGKEFVPGQSQVGQTLTVVATYTDATGTNGQIKTTTSEVVQNANDRPTGYVRIDGTGEVGQKLKVSFDLQDLDGFDPKFVSYEWRRDGVDIQNSNAPEYVVQRDDLGTSITVAVLYWDWRGTLDGMVSGNAVRALPARAPNAADTTSPSIALSSSTDRLAIGQQALITFTLSEASTNFELGDVSFSGGQLSGLSGAGQSYTALFTPLADFEGTALISLASSVFSDAAGNLNNDGGEANNRWTFTVDTLAPMSVSSAPANQARQVSSDANLSIRFSEAVQSGTGSITLKTAAGQVVETFQPKSSRLQWSGDGLTIDPTKDLGVFTSYVLQVSADAVRDSEGNHASSATTVNFRTTTLDSLYHFFVVAFAAAPGASYMGQLAEAVNYGLSVAQIVEIFTTKPQFTSVYPTTMTNRELATQLVNNIVKNSASAAVKQSAIDDIDGALGIGWSRGKMLFTVFGNLASKPLTDPTWGATAKQFQNQLAVARYFTEEMGVATENLATLRGVIGNVTPDTDVSTIEKIVQIIGAVPPGG